MPPRPDGDLQPELRRAWERGFGKPLILRPFIFDERLVRRNRFRLARQEMMRATATTSRFETSTNWSGAYITSNRFKKFVLIFAVWKVPEQLQKPLPGKTRNGLGFRTSVPTGLDSTDRGAILTPRCLRWGQPRHCWTLRGTDPPAMAWIQWWATSGGDIGPLPINFAIKPGDEVLCV